MKKWIWTSMIVAAVGLAGCGDSSGGSSKAGMPSPTAQPGAPTVEDQAKNEAKPTGTAQAAPANPTTTAPSGEKEEATNNPSVANKESASTTINGKKNPPAPKMDPIGPDHSKPEVAAVRVAPSGNIKDFVGTYEMDDPQTRAINAAMAKKGLPGFHGTIDIKADGTYKFVFGTKGVVVTTGTIVAKDHIVELHPLLVNGKPATKESEKLVYNMRLQPDGKTLQMTFIPKGRTEGKIRTFIKK